MPATSVTAAVKFGISASGRLSDTSRTSIGASRRRGPGHAAQREVDRYRAVHHGEPATRASPPPSRSSSASGSRTRTCRCTSGSDAVVVLPLHEVERALHVRIGRPCRSTCASRLTRPVTGRSLCSSSATFSTAKSVICRSKFAVPFRRQQSVRVDAPSRTALQLELRHLDAASCPSGSSTGASYASVVVSKRSDTSASRSSLRALSSVKSPFSA